MKSPLKKVPIFLLTVIVVAGLAYFLYNKVTTGTQNEEKSYKVKRTDLTETLSISGEIDALEKIDLKFQSSGMLVWVGVKEGDFVKKYQGIASLDKKELEMNLKKYLNTFLKYRWDYDQEKEDQDIKNIGNLSEDARREALRSLDKAQFDLNNAVLDVELKDLALKYSYLYTPIEGIVTSIDTPYAGVNITPATAVFKIVNPKTVYFSATADQTDVINLNKGKKGELILDPYPEEEIQGTVEDISFIPKAGETGTVYQVKIGFDNNNEDYRYRVGMTGDISFIIKEKKNVLSIPSAYLKKEKGEYYVVKLVDNKKEKTKIEIGEEIDGDVIIFSGLEEGDLIYD